MLAADFGVIQRARILGAARAVACERGAGGVTVAGVVARAGISRRTFYESFADAEACLLATLEDGLVQTRARVLEAYGAASGPWQDRVRAALVELLRHFEERPDVARLLVVEWPAAGHEALSERHRVLSRLAVAVDRLQPGSKRSDSAQIVTEGAIGGALAILYARLLARESMARLVSLAGPLMSMIVLYPLGASAARRELERPAPEPTGSAVASVADAPLGDPLSGLEMRLTYRTVSVLAAIAANPGGSNRAIAQAAGVGDQGQISKLLRRLLRLGLVENDHGELPSKGEPNAWRLTERGKLVASASRSIA